MTPDQIRQSYLYSMIKGFREPPKRIPGPWQQLTSRCCIPFFIFFGFISLLFFIFMPVEKLWESRFFIMAFTISALSIIGFVINGSLEFFCKDKYFVPNPAYETWPMAPPEIKPVPWLTVIASVFAIICGILVSRGCSHSFLKSSETETISCLLSGCFAWIFWTAARCFGKPKPKDND